MSLNNNLIRNRSKNRFLVESKILIAIHKLVWITCQAKVNDESLSCRYIVSWTFAWDACSEIERVLLHLNKYTKFLH